MIKDDFTCLTASGLKCPEPDIPLGGSVSRDKDDGDTAIYSCDHHLRLVGEKRRTCRGGVWQGGMPHCDREYRISVTVSSRTMLKIM